MTGSSERVRPSRILPAIVISQFAGTSLWFATNAIIPDLRETWQLGEGAIGSVTSAVQFGFITGTLLAAFFTLADRFSPRRIFLLSSLFGAVCNLLVLVAPRAPWSLLALRFLTGIALAGIYPVGMKIASGWYRHGLGSALGFLVGALVLGTSFPHLLRGMDYALDWQEVIVAVSLLAASGGILMAVAVPDGPYLTATASFSLASLPAIFAKKDLRAAAVGYFGHMWELYTFYAFVPVMLTLYAGRHPGTAIDVSFWSFCIIGAGFFGCSIGGVISRSAGSVRVAAIQLSMSGALCLFSPFLFDLHESLFLGLMILWGIVVVGDSPQFSALIAKYAPAGLVGSALTMSNSTGFAITIVSIQCIGFLSKLIPGSYLLFPLFAGPLIGVFSLFRLRSVEGGRQLQTM